MSPDAATLIASVALVLSLVALFRPRVTHHHEESYFMRQFGEEPRSLGRRHRGNDPDFDAGEIEDDPGWMRPGY